MSMKNKKIIKSYVKKDLKKYNIEPGHMVG